MAFVFGIILGGWYGYANYLRLAHEFSCNKVSQEIEFKGVFFKITEKYSDLTVGKSLVGYRGGSQWRLFFRTETHFFETAGMSGAKVESAMTAAIACGLQNRRTKS